MYLPAHFEETRAETLHALLRAHPLGLLVTRTAAAGADALADELQANSLPFGFDAGAGGTGLGTLRAHVARANPLWREARRDVDSLVVFQGPQAYVSPSFYASKAEHGKVVPTWNYVTVQARGRLRVVDDAAWVRAFVTRLTEHHEAQRAAPWALDDAPADFIDTLLGAIVGIEIELTSLVGKWKVSQNRAGVDRAADADQLALGTPPEPRD